MKIYVGHSKGFDFKEELYRPLRESQLNLKHEIILPHEVYQEAEDFITKDIIKNCDLMIAEVSLSATGLGIEIGWADSFGRPLVCIYRQGSKISGSLKVVCKYFIEYNDKDDLIGKVESFLDKIGVAV